MSVRIPVSISKTQLHSRKLAAALQVVSANVMVEVSGDHVVLDNVCLVLLEHASKINQEVGQRLLRRLLPSGKLAL